MKERMRRDWVFPILDDIRAFLRESDLPDMARDIDDLLDRYGSQLLEDAPTPAPVKAQANAQDIVPARVIKFPDR